MTLTGKGLNADIPRQQFKLRVGVNLPIDPDLIRVVLCLAFKLDGVGVNPEIKLELIGAC